MRGIGVRRRQSIRVEGLAYQPGGIGSVLIDGREAQVEARPGGDVKFVGYAHADSVAGEVEIAAYSTGPAPPVVRTYPYEPAMVSDDPVPPSDAWSEGRGFEGERYAVVVGISEYADPAITPLRYADDDAQSFYDFLLSERAGLGGFEPDNVRFLVNETADTRAVRTAMTTFLRQVTERDVVVIYIAGHGAADPFRPDDYYLLTHDTEATNFAGTAISMADIDEYVRRLRARDIIVFTDACHSAALTGGGVGLRAGTVNDINRIFLERLSATAAGLLTFTASETNQYSQEGPQWGGGHGIFTYELLRGLEGDADDDADGIVTLGELVEYTRSAVQRATGNQQVPFVGSGSFDRSWPISVVPVRVADDADTQLAAPAVEVDTPVPVDSLAVAAPSVTDVSALADEPAPSEAAADSPVAENEDLDDPDAIPANANLLSPAGTFAQSLLIPGSGQMRTGRTWRGLAVLGGALAATTYGIITTRLVKKCREATVGGECLSGQFTEIKTERPNLVAGLAIANGLSLLGAIDALIGAREVNAERRRGTETAQVTGVKWSVLPNTPLRSTRFGDLRLVELRFR